MHGKYHLWDVFRECVYLTQQSLTQWGVSVGVQGACAGMCRNEEHFPRQGRGHRTQT